MLKFVSSSEPFEYQMENTAMKEGRPTRPFGLRIMSLMESHIKTRELLASNLAEAGQCFNELFKKVIFQQMQDNSVPTHYSTNTPGMHPTVNQRVLPALGYYADAESPRKRVLCSEDDEDAGRPKQRVRCDEPGQNADEHRKCANYSVGDEDAGYHHRHVRCSQGYEGSKDAGSYHGGWYDKKRHIRPRRSQRSGQL